MPMAPRLKSGIFVRALVRRAKIIPFKGAA